MNRIFIIGKKSYIRLIIYLIIWQLYLFFMSVNAPLGAGWLDWHSQRIFNFSEYLNLNGFFTHLGFSIWSSCSDCSLSLENSKNLIYLNLNLFSQLPYVILNKFLGENYLNLYGHLIDKTIIFFTGILIAEIFIKFNNKKRLSAKIVLKTLLIFIFFIINPWTYKMILAYWIQIFFVFFFLLGILMFLSKKDNLGLLFFFLAGCFDYQSSTGLFIYFSFFVIYSKLNKNLISHNNFFPCTSKKKFIEYKIIFSFLFPIVIFFFLRLIVSDQFDSTNAAFLLDRIGISGNDTHNGGILGSLQFLGGNRISQCLINLDSDLNSISLISKIHIFNCSLSILSMFLISIISLCGLTIISSRENKLFNLILCPFLFLLISYTFLLQQSSSAHLMGYSYFFSIIFSFGLSSIIFSTLQKYKFSVIAIVLSLPIIAGFIILSIRVSMLTGIHG